MAHAALAFSFARMHKDSYSDWKATVVMSVAVLLLVMSGVFTAEIALGKRFALTNVWALLVAGFVTVAVHLVLTKSRLRYAAARLQKLSPGFRGAVVALTWLSVFGAAILVLTLSQLLVRSRGATFP